MRLGPEAVDPATHDGRRDLKKVAPNYASFRVGDDGSLTPVGQPQPTYPQASPTQAFVTPDGKFMLATDERGEKKFAAGKLHSFRIAKDGSLSPAPGSPSGARA